MNPNDQKLVELHHLRRWKAEASEVMMGLQDLGRVLDLPLGTRITGELAAETARKLRERADAAEAELARLQDNSPTIECRCGRKIYVTIYARFVALADRMETSSYQADSDGWGHICAQEIRHELGLEPECRCPWNTPDPAPGPAPDQPPTSTGGTDQ